LALHCWHNAHGGRAHNLFFSNKEYLVKIRKLAIPAMLALAFASPSAFANLISNGGFETDTVTGPALGLGYQYLPSGLSDWLVSSPGHRGVVLFNSTYAPNNVQGVGAGINSVQIEFPGDYIQQTITTVAGAQYSLAFLLNIYTQPGLSAIGAVDVTVDGVATSLANPIVGSNGWAVYNATFIAADTSTDLRFTSAQFYPHLDNITVEASGVPEPAMLALFGLGLAGLGFSRRKAQV
jgi:hypothetical protein